MKMINNKRVLLILSVVAVMSGFFGACSDDNEDVSSREVELLSFGPSGQKHGQNIIFLGKNLNLVTAIKLEGAEIPKDKFISQSTDKIEIKIPMETVEGKAMLIFEGGQIISKTIVSFDVPFMIASISPQVKPGGTMTITGEYLNWVKSVIFTDGLEVTEFESASLTKLVVKVPFDAKTGPIEIVGGGTEPYPFKSENDIKVTLPMITSVSPAAVKHNELLTITGTDLDLAKSITFPNSTPVLGFESQTATKIVVRVPVTTKDGTVKVTAFSNIATEAPMALHIILPVVTAATPKPVAVAADLTLTGTNLDLVKEVIIPGAASPITSFVSKSESKIVVKVPANSFNGVIKLKTIYDFVVETTAKIEIAGLTSIPLARVIFDDALQNGFNNWSWSVTSTIITSEVVEGSKALRIDFTGDGGLKLANANLSTTGMSELVFSVYGGAGLGNGGKLGLMVNNKWSIKSIQTVPGAWKEIVIPISELVGLGVSDANSAIKEMALQNNSGYFIIDKVGLR